MYTERNLKLVFPSFNKTKSGQYQHFENRKHLGKNIDKSVAYLYHLETKSR